ncbi:MAG TPA: hypothetical protein VF895_11380 [Gaiellaceae bacterium]
MAVERSRWTDDRLDELADRVMRQDVLEVRFDGLERRFDGLESAVQELRLEMQGLRGDLTGQANDLRSDLSGQVNSLRSELYDTRRWLMTMWLTGLLGLAALFVEISLRT